MKSISILYFTNNGGRLARKLIDRAGSAASGFARRDGQKLTITAASGKGAAREWTRQHFGKGNVLVYIGACGIAVRLIAPLIRSKAEDPAVIVVDEGGRFVIPILSGHLGGANEFAQVIADLIGAQVVITTATDTHDLFAVDVFAGKNGLVISDMGAAKHYSASLLENRQAGILIPDSLYGIVSITGTIPPEVRVWTESEEKTEAAGACLGSTEMPGSFPEARAVVTPFISVAGDRSPSAGLGRSILTLIPRCIVVGMGCRRGKSSEDLHLFLQSVLERLRIREEALHSLVSIDVKRDEEGLVQLAEQLDIPFVTYSADVLNETTGLFKDSDVVRRAVGTGNVCERAVAAAGSARILLRKTAWNGMTVSVGILPVELRF